MTPINLDDAAALILSMLADPSGRIVPAEAYQLLTARNQAPMDAPADEIKAILARQVTVLKRSRSSTWASLPPSRPPNGRNHWLESAHPRKGR